MFTAVLLCSLLACLALFHPSLAKRICSFVDNGDNQTVFDKMAWGGRGEKRMVLALDVAHRKSSRFLHFMQPLPYHVIVRGN